MTNAWYESKKSDMKEERLRIVETAATIIREDIRSIPYDLEYFPLPNQFLTNVETDVPKTLTVFLSKDFGKNKKSPKNNHENKYIALANRIISCCSPRSFNSTILLSLGLYLHRNIGTKRAVDIFSSFGFCASYNEVYVFVSS